MISSNRYLQFSPDKLSYLEGIITTKSKYYPLCVKADDSTNVFTIPCISAFNYLSKAIKIVENTEEYTEYLLIRSFGDGEVYKKTPPGSIRIYEKNLVCFYNGKTWRKLK
jgi:hypothetical protein